MEEPPPYLGDLPPTLPPTEGEKDAAAKSLKPPISPKIAKCTKKDMDIGLINQASKNILDFYKLNLPSEYFEDEIVYITKTIDYIEDKLFKLGDK